MSQPDTKKRSLISFISSLSPRNKTILGILIILVVTVLAVLYAPPEGESNNVTGDLPYTPTVTINNLVETVNINRSFTYGDVHITVTKAMLATKYSDDRRRGGVYTVRVMAQAENKGAQPVGVDYISLTRLVLPDGQEIAPKRISLPPASMPGGPKSGFIDFPVSSQVPLSSLTMKFASTTNVPFMAQS